MSNRIRNSRVLVTGGAGFIGSNLCIDLLKYNNEVIVLDNLSTGSFKNIQYCMAKKFQLIVGDIRNLNDCQKAVDGVDYVFHQAALGSVPRSIYDPLTTHNVNLSGFLNMLIAAKDAKIKRFIFASSSSVYGDSKTLPKVEQHLGEPLSPYAITKRCNEMYACCFANLYEGLEVIGLRYFNVFGRHQDPFSVYAAVIPKFIMAFMNHTAPVINADGNQSRDFTYIENVIEANHLAALTTNKKAINNIFNTACGDRMTLNTLCSYIRELLSKYDPLIASIEPSYGPSRKGDIPHSHASIEKIQQLLGYQVQYDVQSGLKDAIDWYYTQAASWKEEPSLTSTPCLT